MSGHDNTYVVKKRALRYHYEKCGWSWDGGTRMGYERSFGSYISVERPKAKAKSKNKPKSKTTKTKKLETQFESAVGEKN